ncbi:hypothetical protein HYALB_00013159, partial [Hymenoscyphus albidus]
MSTQGGGCFCNQIRLQFTGEPKLHALCHCADCKKISGGDYSNNIVVTEDNFKLLSGTPKKISKKADTGKEITSHFCGGCGTTCYRTGESFPGQVILKAGVLDSDEWVNTHTPAVELFAPERVKMHGAVEGAAQLTA